MKIWQMTDDLLWKRYLDMKKYKYEAWLQYQILNQNWNTQYRNCILYVLVYIYSPTLTIGQSVGNFFCPHKWWRHDNIELSASSRERSTEMQCPESKKLFARWISHIPTKEYMYLIII